MTFRDIERTIGALLPRSAQRPQWWANERSAESRHVQCAAWLDAGFSAHLSVGSEKVSFKRMGR